MFCALPFMLQRQPHRRLDVLLAMAAPLKRLGLNACYTAAFSFPVEQRSSVHAVDLTQAFETDRYLPPPAARSHPMPGGGPNPVRVPAETPVPRLPVSMLLATPDIVYTKT